MWLDDYPLLQNWYADHKLERQKEPYEALLCGVVGSVQEQDEFDVAVLLTGMSHFLGKSKDIAADYGKVEKFLQSDEFDVDQYWSQSSHWVMQSDYGELYYKTFSVFSEALRRPSVDFLSAWMAFNLDKFEECVATCQRVHPPFGSVWTLCGQAQLESGDPDAAIESLTQATQLMPQDLLSWFQLAKSAWAGSDDDLCRQSLQTCRELSPQHPEVLLFSCFLAQKGYHDLADDLYHVCEDLEDPSLLEKADFVTALLSVFVENRHQKGASWLAGAGAWGQVIFRPEVMADVAALLSQMHEMGWHDCCREILSHAD